MFFSFKLIKLLPSGFVNFNERTMWFKYDGLMTRRDKSEIVHSIISVLHCLVLSTAIVVSGYTKMARQLSKCLESCM